MKKSKNGGSFIVVIILLIVGLLTALYFLGRHQEEVVEKSFPSFDSVEVTKEVTDFDYANQPVIGDEKAPVSVVKFGDYKCPACAQWEKFVYPQLYSEYIETGKAKFYFINFPFLAPDSRLAALAGELVYKQSNDAFWQYYQAVYANQPSEAQTWATHEYLTKLVKENVKGIDFEKFEKDLAEFKGFEDVAYDNKITEKMGVTGTPAIFINGEKTLNPSFEQIKPLIEAELAKVKGN